jgi:hypothetical protein
VKHLTRLAQEIAIVTRCGIAPQPRVRVDFAPDEMTIRKLERQRYIAWMAVVAVLLLSVVPTISQIVLTRAQHAHASMTVAEHTGHLGHMPTGDRDDECWRKCGYCDFLAHTPAIATIAYVPAFAGAAAPIPIDSSRAEPRYALPTRAAQPRGPPSILA